MKKIRILAVSLAAMVVLAVASLTMAGCGGSPASLSGTSWKVTSLTVNGTDYLSTLTTAAQAQGYTDVEMDLSFKDEDTYEYVFSYKDSNGETQTKSYSDGDYTYENGTLTIEGTEVAINGNTATFTQSSMNAEMTIQKK